MFRCRLDGHEPFRVAGGCHFWGFEVHCNDFGRAMDNMLGILGAAAFLVAAALKLLKVAEDPLVPSLKAVGAETCASRTCPDASLKAEELELEKENPAHDVRVNEYVLLLLC